MTNDELKKKILSIVRGAILEADELPFIETTDNIADALIAAGIGDVKETEHRAEVAERALKRFAENISCEDCPFFSDCSSLEKMKDSVKIPYIQIIVLPNIYGKPKKNSRRRWKND